VPAAFADGRPEIYHEDAKCMKERRNHLGEQRRRDREVAWVWDRLKSKPRAMPWTKVYNLINGPIIFLSVKYFNKDHGASPSTTQSFQTRSINGCPPDF